MSACFCPRIFHPSSGSATPEFSLLIFVLHVSLFQWQKQRPWISLLWEWNMLLALCNGCSLDSLKRKQKTQPNIKTHPSKNVPEISGPLLNSESCCADACFFWPPECWSWNETYLVLSLSDSVQHKLRESEEQYFGTGTQNPNTCTHAAWCFISGYKLDYNMVSPCGHYPGKPGWICLMHKTNLAKWLPSGN